MMLGSVTAAFLLKTIMFPPSRLRRSRSLRPGYFKLRFNILVHTNCELVDNRV